MKIQVQVVSLIAVALIASHVKAETINALLTPATATASGDWDVSFTEVSPTMWSYSIVADATNVPNLAVNLVQEQEFPGVTVDFFSEGTQSIGGTGGVSGSIAFLPSSLKPDRSNSGSGFIAFASAVADPLAAVEFSVVTQPYYPFNEAVWAGTPPVPLPASAWLLLSGLSGLGVFARKKRAA